MPPAWGPTLGSLAPTAREEGARQAFATTQGQSTPPPAPFSCCEEVAAVSRPGRRNGWPVPFPRGQLCGGWPPQGPIHHPEDTHKDWSEQHGGGTSERRKGRVGQKGRTEGGKEGGEEVRTGRGRATGSCTHACPPEQGLLRAKPISHPQTNYSHS